MSKFSNKVVELYPWLRSRARMYVKSDQDVDDLVSETVLRLLQNREKYDRSMDLKPWSAVVMKNLYCNWYHRKSSVQFLELKDVHYSYSKVDYEYEEMMEILSLHSGKSLNVHCVELFMQGYSYEEISVMLNIKIGTVRSRIFNGRKLLKVALEL